MSETDVIKPYEGGPVPQSPGAAAQEFSKAFPQYQQALVKGKNVLTPNAQRSLNELRQQMRANPPKPATVINLHPWELMFPSGTRLLRGIQIPACHPGQPMAWHHIRGWRQDWKYDTEGELVFYAILPIQLAGEFMREFSDKERAGGGVIIYEGGDHPDKVNMVETYDVLGRPATKDAQGFEYDGEERPIPAIVQQPIVRPLAEMIEDARQKRNKFYMEKVRKADHDWNMPDGRGRQNITAAHLLMAEVLFHDGLIAKMPNWNLSSRLEEGLAQDNCPACGTPRRKDAFMCKECRHPILPVEAYKHGAITYDQVLMHSLTSDEIEEVEEIRLEREQAIEEAKKKRTAPAGGKAEGESKGKKKDKE